MHFFPSYFLCSLNNVHYSLLEVLEFLESQTQFMADDVAIINAAVFWKENRQQLSDRSVLL